MDGSGASSFDLRLPRTEQSYGYEFPELSVFRFIQAVLQYYGSVRPVMADGCP